MLTHNSIASEVAQKQLVEFGELAAKFAGEPVPESTVRIFADRLLHSLVDAEYKDRIAQEQARRLAAVNIPY